MLFLTHRSYQVTACSNLRAARDLLARNVFQLIVAGIQRLAENVFDFSRSLRIEGNYAPVIFMGKRASEDEIRGRMTGSTSASCGHTPESPSTPSWRRASRRPARARSRSSIRGS
jgi:DNA-binding response OmpR family regulator